MKRATIRSQRIKLYICLSNELAAGGNAAGAMEATPAEPQSDSTDGDALQRRIAQLEQRVADRDLAIEELNATASAFKLLREKLIAEINAKDILLNRKNERIEELVTELQSAEQNVQARDHRIQMLEEKEQALQAEIADLKDQLTKEEEEFTMVCAAVETREQQLKKKSEELVAAKEVERQLRKDVDRFQVNIRRLEKDVDDLNPETADACLSPRSFSENHLIQLRDDTIQAKTKEIWLLSGQNDQLRIQLDELEAEMERLQTSYVSKENDVARRDRKIEKLEAEIESLHVSRKQAEGREKAIEIATTQNAKLLQALQLQDTACEDLTLRLEQSEMECAKLRMSHRQFLEKSAVNEVEVLHKTKEVEEKSSAVTVLQEKLTRERRELHKELHDARIKYQLEVEKLQSELVMRRNKQYELTLRLQEADAKLHQATDDLETASEQLVVTRCRMEEAERVLHDSLLWKKQLEDEISRHKKDAVATTEQNAEVLQAAQTETSALKLQLTELKQSLLKCIEKEKHQAFQIQDLKRALEAKDGLVHELKDRIARLVQEVASESKLRAEIDLERGVLAQQLDKVRSRMETSIQECYEQNKRLEERYKRATERFKRLEMEATKEQLGKSKVVLKFVDAYGMAVQAGLAMSTKITGGPVATNSTCLDLRDCWLTDHDLGAIMTMVESPSFRFFTRLDLRSNRLTQDGMRLISAYFRKKWKQGSLGTGIGCIRELDLRNNFIAIDGVRTVAGGLEGLMGEPSTSPTAPMKSVVIKQGGRIECFPDESMSNNEIPMLTVDITGNSEPHFLLSEGRRAAQRRRPRDEDHHETKDTEPDPLQEIYGMDLVSAFMSQEKALPAPTARRKSVDKPRLPVAVALPMEQQSPRAPAQSLLLPSHSAFLDTGAALASGNTNSNGSSNNIAHANPPGLDGARGLSSSSSLPKL